MLGEEWQALLASSRGLGTGGRRPKGLTHFVGEAWQSPLAARWQKGLVSRPMGLACGEVSGDASGEERLRAS